MWFVLFCSKKCRFCRTICYLCVSNLIYHLLFSESINNTTFQILSSPFLLKRSRNWDLILHFSGLCIAWSLNPRIEAWISKVIWTIILTIKSHCSFFCKPSPELCLQSEPVKNLQIGGCNKDSGCFSIWCQKPD